MQIFFVWENVWKISQKLHWGDRRHRKVHNNTKSTDESFTYHTYANFSCAYLKINLCDLFPGLLECSTYVVSFWKKSVINILDNIEQISSSLHRESICQPQTFTRSIMLNKLRPKHKSRLLLDIRNPNWLNLEQRFWSRQLPNLVRFQTDTKFTIPTLQPFTFDVILSRLIPVFHIQSISTAEKCQGRDTRHLVF